MSPKTQRLYKLMLMYMLNKVSFPLSNSQLSDFMLGKQYTNYYNFQESLHSLEDDNFIHSTQYHNSTQYILTEKGKETIDFFYDKISPSIRLEIDKYLNENKYELKCEVATLSDYYKNTSGEYTAHLRVVEDKNTLIDLSLSVPSEEQAQKICTKWKSNNQDIYEYIINKLI